jgi:metal-responsive CopG/Arc/MetJ family transcriptional regulator
VISLGDKKMIHLQLEQELVNRLDDFRFSHRIDNRTDVIRLLLDWALKNYKEQELK